MEHRNGYIGRDTLRSLVESAENIGEATVSKERQYRLAKLKRNEEWIEALKKAILGGQMQDSHANAPSSSELMRDIRSTESMNKRLGEEAWLKTRGNAWTNQIGLYVDRELTRIGNVIAHHGGPRVVEPMPK